MSTAVIIIFIIVIAIASFCLGIRVGARLTANKTLEIVFKALDESSCLINEQRLEIVKKIQEIAKKL